jgi:hypothetical protein
MFAFPGQPNQFLAQELLAPRFLLGLADTRLDEVAARHDTDQPSWLRGG